jgi:hypothetical protein
MQYTPIRCRVGILVSAHGRPEIAAQCVDTQKWFEFPRLISVAFPPSL